MATRTTDHGGDPERDARGGAADPVPPVHIGSANNSAFAFGSHARASTVNNPTAPGGDPVQLELLEAVRTLRADLERLVPTPAIEVLDAELVEAEAEISSAGAAGPARLERLRTSLAAAGEWVGALGSGVAVAQLVTALVGG
ncbi:hypothetical protein ABZ714_21975 [Streptomyces sp. NPDC006798]|uniref:hypothetical protein n=1 Tax=Streptomyces sp. NPDC006798 TaxID=3155462 RepID=UPI0033F68E38